jgi:hypothetical protein
MAIVLCSSQPTIISLVPIDPPTVTRAQLKVLWFHMLCKMKVGCQMATQPRPRLTASGKSCTTALHFVGTDGSQRQYTHRCCEFKNCFIVASEGPVHCGGLQSGDFIIGSVWILFEQVGDKPILKQLFKSCLSDRVLGIRCGQRRVLIRYFTINLPRDKQANKQDIELRAPLIGFDRAGTTSNLRECSLEVNVESSQ